MINISIRASQKSGMEMTAKDRMLTVRSIIPRGRLAASMPMGIPSIPMAQATAARAAVLGRRSQTRLRASMEYLMERSKSPVRKLKKKSPNRTYMGWSNPYFARIASMTSCVASSPANNSTGSPSTLTAKKSRAIRPKTMKTEWPKRRIM